MSEARTRLMTKGVIYEVKLFDWIDRTDLDGEGNFMKTEIIKAMRREWEKPADIDEIVFSCNISFSFRDPIHSKKL